MLLHILICRVLYLYENMYLYLSNYVDVCCSYSIYFSFILEREKWQEFYPFLKCIWHFIFISRCVFDRYKITFCFTDIFRSKSYSSKILIFGTYYEIFQSIWQKTLVACILYNYLILLDGRRNYKIFSLKMPEYY